MHSTGVVLCGDIICQIVIKDQTQQAVEQSQVNLLVNLRKDGFHKNIAFAFAGFPDVSQVVDTLAPLRVPCVRSR